MLNAAEADQQPIDTLLLANLTLDTFRVAKALHHENLLAGIIYGIFPALRQAGSGDTAISRVLNDRNPKNAIKKATQDYMPAAFRTAITVDSRFTQRRITNSLRNKHLTVIGGGPATLIPTWGVASMGVQPEHVIGVSDTGEWGGMWFRDRDGAGVTFNNPLPLQVGRAVLADNGQPDRRHGYRLRGFLGEIVNDAGIRERMVKGRALATYFGEGVTVHASLSRPFQHGINTGEIWLNSNVKHLRSGRFVGADVALIGLGNEPKPLETSKMETNATQFEDGIERWQRPLTEGEARKLDGKKIIIVGLGNSTLRQISFVEQANRDWGVKIKVVVLTHFSEEGLHDPYNIYERADGTSDRLARDPIQGELTNLELDLPDSNLLYQNFLLKDIFYDEEGIIPMVNAWHISQVNDNPNEYLVKVSTSSSNFAQNIEVGDVGAIFVLGGYHTPPEVLQNMGFQIDPQSGRALIRPSDGARIDENGDVDASILLTGFASQTEITPNVGTIPGTMGRFPEQVFSMIMQMLLSSSI